MNDFAFDEMDGSGWAKVSAQHMDDDDQCITHILGIKESSKKIKSKKDTEQVRNQHESAMKRRWQNNPKLGSRVTHCFLFLY